MKKLFTLFLAAALFLSVIGCAAQSPASTVPETNAPETEATTLPAETTQPAETTLPLQTEAPTVSTETVEATEAAVHTHSYSKATCTIAATCDCGATKGNALGHKWKAATCKAPKTCKTCGAKTGTAADHKWQAATCEKPETCKTCGMTQGTTSAHIWQTATCEKPKACKTCGITDGNASGHSWQAATCQAPQTCSVCSATEGKKGSHSYVEGICSVCSASQYADIASNLAADTDYAGNYRLVGSELRAYGINFSHSEDVSYTLIMEHYHLNKEAYLETLKEAEGDDFDGTLPDWISPYEFNGVEYYHFGAGFTPYESEFVNNELVVYDQNDASRPVIFKFALRNDGYLVVTYTTDSDRFPLGMLLTKTPQEILTCK